MNIEPTSSGPILKVKRLDPEAPLPTIAKDGDACFDLRALLFEPTFISIFPGEQVLFATGLCFAIPRGYCMEVYSRSGHGINASVKLSNGTGIIDSGYRGQLVVGLRNDGSRPFLVRHLDRIAQFKLVEVPATVIVEVDELDETERGTGGLGSTGVQ